MARAHCRSPRNPCVWCVDGLGRSCNAPYVLWITAQCLACLVPLALGQALHELNHPASARPGARGDSSGGVWRPRLPCAANSSPLAVFLLANLLTGAVNLSINTLQVTQHTAVGIVGEWQAGNLCRAHVHGAQWRGQPLPPPAWLPGACSCAGG